MGEEKAQPGILLGKIKSLNKDQTGWKVEIRGTVSKRPLYISCELFLHESTVSTAALSHHHKCPGRKMPFLVLTTMTANGHELHALGAARRGVVCATSHVRPPSDGIQEVHGEDRACKVWAHEGTTGGPREQGHWQGGKTSLPRIYSKEITPTVNTNKCTRSVHSSAVHNVSKWEAIYTSDSRRWQNKM